MIASLCLTLLMQVTTFEAQAGQPPARDVKTVKGTASVKGKVVGADSGRPMRRVQISLSSPDLSESRSMSTTALGIYEFKELPAGRYTISAAREGFVRLQSGQRRPGEPGRPLQLADGQRVENADFSLPRTGSISGRITDELGDPLPGVSFYPAHTIKNVPPGEYRLSIRGPGDKEHPPEGITMTVSVTGEDLAGVMLVGGSGGSLSGRIVSDTGTPVPAPETSRMRVSARPVDPTSTYASFGDNDNGRVKDDGAFEVTSVYGQNKLTVSPLPAGWAVRAIEHGGKDYADVPIDLRGGTRLDGVSIVLSKTLPRVQGTLADEQRQPTGGSVLLFPEESSKWGEDARLVRSARPDLAGAFEFRNVIPGSYLIVALEYVRDGEWADPEFLENLREKGTRVRVDDKGATAVTLTLKK